MAQIETWYKQDIKKAVQVQYINGNLFSQDNQGNIVGVEVYDNNEPVTLSGTVSGNFIRADGGTVAITGAYEGNRAYVVIPQSAYAVPGTFALVVKLTDDSVVTTLLAVSGTVYRSSTDTEVDPGTVMPSIETLIAQIEAAVDSIPADYSNLWETLAPNYDNLTFPVLKGQYCTHSGKFYTAKQDIPVSETWTSSHWKAANVGVDLAGYMANTFALGAGNARPIASNDDLDNYTTPGNYYCANTTIANTLSHCPYPAGFRLTVETLNSTVAYKQTIEVTNGGLYTRVYTSGAWTEWANPGLALDWHSCISIPENADLDSYNNAGNYRCASSAIAATLSNCPVSVSFSLAVKTHVSGASVSQILFVTNGAIFTRTYTNSNWTLWFSLSGSITLDTKGRISIPNNSDLNDYTEAGNYVIPTASGALTLKNYPTYIGGVLIVMYMVSTAGYTQTLITNNGNIYTRAYTSGAWTLWMKLETEMEAFTRSTTDARSAYSQALPLIKAAEYDLAFANAVTPISMTNYVGNTENVHPKVRYFASGFGGHKFWMAYTPYPRSKDRFENPCIAYSDDGYFWTNIDGNPLDDPQGDGYNSDTHLVYRSDTGNLECWYRYFDANEDETIYRQTSSDGVTWSTKEVLATSTAEASEYLSPAIEWDGTNYNIWVMSSNSGKITYYTASGSNPASWTKVREYSISFSDDGLSVNPWHLDVIIDGSTYIMVVMCRNGTQITNNRCSVFVTTSSDNITYSSPVKVIGGSLGWDRYMYRPSIVKVGDVYRIYYSASSGGTETIYNNALWGIGITESETLDHFYGHPV